MCTVWYSKLCEKPQSCDACFAGDPTMLWPNCPLWLHHRCLGDEVQLQLQFKREILSHWVAWKQVGALKIHERIPLVGWPKQPSRLSRSDSWVLHCSLFVLPAARGHLLFVQTVRLLMLEEKVKDGGRHGQDWNKENIRECDGSRCLLRGEQVALFSQLSSLRMAAKVRPSSWLSLDKPGS